MEFKEVQKKDTLELMGIAVTISIFLPAVIFYFFNVVNSTNANYFSLKYLILPGVSIISYCIIYLRNLNNHFLNKIILSNLILIGISTIWMSLVIDFPLITNIYLSYLINYSQSILFLSFVFLPIIILFLSIFIK